MQDTDSASSDLSSSEILAARDKLSSHLNHFYLPPDFQGVEIILAAYRAHFFRGTKPVWMWIVGPSGSGKTEIGIRVLEGLPAVFQIGDLTTKAFLTAKANQKGLLQRLPRMGDKHHGILTFKDFTTFLSKRPDDRAELVAQMREIADGYWSKHTGETSARMWEGRVTVIAACTYELEFMWGTLRKMGERFISLHWRYPEDANEGLGQKLMLQMGHEEEIAVTTKSLAAKWVGSPGFTDAPIIPIKMTHEVMKMCRVACWMREPVHRNSHGQIDDNGPREPITRLNKSIHSVIAGYAALYGRNVIESDISIARRLAWDSTPTRKAKIVGFLRNGADCDLRELRAATGLPKTSIHREIEELETIGILYKVVKDNETSVRLTDEFMAIDFD